MSGKKVIEWPFTCPPSVYNECTIGGPTCDTSGKSISITFHDDETVPAVYQVEYKGKNTMIWTPTYSRVHNPGDVKSLTLIFNRLSQY